MVSFLLTKQNHLEIFNYFPAIFSEVSRTAKFLFDPLGLRNGHPHSFLDPFGLRENNNGSFLDPLHLRDRGPLITIGGGGGGGGSNGSGGSGGSVLSPTIIIQHH